MVCAMNIQKLLFNEFPCFLSLISSHYPLKFLCFPPLISVESSSKNWTLPISVLVHNNLHLSHFIYSQNIPPTIKLYSTQISFQSLLHITILNRKPHREKMHHDSSYNPWSNFCPQLQTLAFPDLISTSTNLHNLNVISRKLRLWQSYELR